MRVTNSAGFLVEKEHLDIRPTLVAIIFPDNQQVTPQSTDNWSRISWRRLGDGRYWWIIADFSEIIDPFSELIPTTQNQYLTQLSVNVPAGPVNQITVADPSVIMRGTSLLVENLDPAHPQSFTCAVNDSNLTTGIVTLSGAVVVPAPGIPFALSRVSQVVQGKVSLTVPSAHTAQFSSLNFSNPLNVLVQ